MSVLAYLALAAILLGIGVLAASILPTRGARVGLGTVLFLALVVDSTWLLAPVGGWLPRLGDAAWLGMFLLIAGAALTTAVHYNAAPERTAWLWPTGRDVAFLGLIVAAFGVVVWALPVPLDTDAQGFGYLALTLRDGQNYTTLAPWHPEIEYLYSPAYPGLIAHLSARLDLGIQTLQLAFSAVTAVVFVWLAYDLGCELENRRTGRAFMLAAVIGVGMITAFFDSHYTALLALDFSLAFLTFVLGFLKEGGWLRAVAAATCLAAVPLSQPDTTIALMIGYVPWLLILVLAHPRPTLARWSVIAIVIPALALLLVTPWLLSIRDLLGADIESPFAVDADHWRTLVFMHGGIVVALAAIGVGIGLRERSPAQWLGMVWMVGIAEFSTTGLLERAFPDLLEPLLKYDYPFSLAWHGPIIPYTILGGTALVGLSTLIGAARMDRLVGRLALPVIALGAGVLAAAVVYFDPLLDASKDTVNFYGAFSSQADVDAMAWLRNNTPEDARVLNHPGPQEGDWAPVISERDTIYFRPQPFFQHDELAQAEQVALRAFWNDPANPDNAALLADYRVQYVLVPQVFGNPGSLDDALRWRAPIPEAASYLSTPVSAAPYLQLVYDNDGARVYRLATTETTP
ncbi:hypothetical protein [Aggregatilinea lenta]|uniref:hypothetical protein n=1 Tax=Aggregatilinea lenta TaxID=913108 RepID=UPI000E5AA08E|nr:hypothetical protein [Aggregatilinea lenta]